MAKMGIKCVFQGVLGLILDKRLIKRAIPLLGMAQSIQNTILR